MRVSFRRDAAKVAIYKAYKVCERVRRRQLLFDIRGVYMLKMHKITLFILAAVLAVALAEGQYYVPRAYYTIDAEGHESARVPLRRLRRSLQPYPYRPAGANANANANANAEAYGGADATANANARASSGGWGSGGWGSGGRGAGYGGGSGGWGVPAGAYGASNPALSSGMTRRQFGPVQGRSVTASSSVGVDQSGAGYYDQSASVH